MKKTYWLDKFEGKVETGYFIRCDLAKQIEKFRKLGKEVVAITLDGDSWNIELICKVSEKPK